MEGRSGIRGEQRDMKIFSFKKKTPEEYEKTLVPPDVPTAKLSYCVANLQGVGMRARQEDSFAFVNVFDVTQIQKKGLMFVVADGMGGMQDGRQASGTAVAALKKTFMDMDREDDIAQQLHDGMFAAGQQVYQALGGAGGSTAVACIIFREMLYFASVGDSFLYLCRNGQMIRLNREHNVRSEQCLERIRAGRMDPVFTDRTPDADALTQFLGMAGMDEVDYLRRPLPLQEGDILLSCSDGIGGVLSQQILLTCMESGHPEEICNALEREIAAQKRRHQDNYTALVVKCTY